jgi:hypothetical protein
MVRSIIIALLAFAPTLALADQRAADACSVALAPDAKLIYAAAAPDFAIAPDPKAEVKAKVQDLVTQGKVGRFTAKSNAMAAADCLKKLR